MLHSLDKKKGYILWFKTSRTSIGPCYTPTGLWAIWFLLVYVKGHNRPSTACVWNNKYLVQIENKSQNRWKEIQFLKHDLLMFQEFINIMFEGAIWLSEKTHNWSDTDKQTTRRIRTGCGSPHHNSSKRSTSKALYIFR